jgi:hypothetical protein
MARKRITKKPDRLRFDREIRKLISDVGGVHVGENSAYEYRMNTKAGPLSIHIHECVDSPGSVMTRFDHALVGESLVGASVPSGKWNHHFSTGETCDDALDYMRIGFERIQPTSLDAFMDETAIVPQAVVETALAERGIVNEYGCRGRLRMTDPIYCGEDRLDFKAAVAWFTKHCEQRLVQLWDINPRIQRQLASDSGRDIAYAFVHHWLDAYLDSSPKYREKHPNWDTAYNYEPMVA